MGGMGHCNNDHSTFMRDTRPGAFVSPSCADAGTQAVSIETELAVSVSENANSEPTRGSLSCRRRDATCSGRLSSISRSVQPRSAYPQRYLVETVDRG